MTQSVVIIGVSADRSKFGNKAVRAFVQQGWTVYPVHPRETIIEGLKTYASVRDLPGPVTLATLYLRPELGLSVIPELAQQGITRLLLNPGTASEELVALAEEHGIAVEHG